MLCRVEERLPRSHACTYSFRRHALCLYGTFSVCAFSIDCVLSKCDVRFYFHCSKSDRQCSTKMH